MSLLPGTVAVEESRGEEKIATAPGLCSRRRLSRLPNCVRTIAKAAFVKYRWKRNILKRYEQERESVLAQNRSSYGASGTPGDHCTHWNMLEELTV